MNINKDPRHFENLTAARQAAKRLAQTPIYRLKKNGQPCVTPITYVDPAKVEAKLAELHRLNPNYTFIAG